MDTALCDAPEETRHEEKDTEQTNRMKVSQTELSVGF